MSSNQLLMMAAADAINGAIGQVHQLARYTIALIASQGPQDIARYLILIIVLAIAYHLLVIDKTRDGPPLIKGWIPFIGVGLSYMSNPEPFLQRCRQQHGDIFTLYMGGKRINVISDPISGIPTIYRNAKAFTIAALAFHFDVLLFGLPPSQAGDKKLYKANLDTLAPLLLAQDMVDILITEFNANLQPILAREISKLNVKKLDHEGVVVDLGLWLKRIMFQASGRTLFGETWPDDDDFFGDFCTWDDYVYSIIKNYPYFMTRKAILARERYFERLVTMFQHGLVNPSKLVKERIKVPSFCIV